MILSIIQYFLPIYQQIKKPKSYQRIANKKYDNGLPIFLDILLTAESKILYISRSTTPKDKKLILVLIYFIKKIKVKKIKKFKDKNY